MITNIAVSVSTPTASPDGAALATAGAEAQKPAKGEARTPGVTLDAEREIFREWLATVAHERQPATQAQLARMLNVNPATLSIWKSNPEFTIAVFTRVRQKYGDRIVGVIEGVTKRAEEGDVAAAKLFLSLICEWQDRAELAIKGNVTVTPERWREIVRETEKVDALPAWLTEAGEGIDQ